MYQLLFSMPYSQVSPVPSGPLPEGKHDIVEKWASCWGVYSRDGCQGPLLQITAVILGQSATRLDRLINITMT